VILPGVLGWEIWTGNGATLSLTEVEPKLRPIDFTELGNVKQLSMVFPVQEANFVPFKIQVEEAALREELISMQLEQLKAQPDEFGGDLLDTFPIQEKGTEETVLATVLEPQYEGSLPSQTPQEFDLSARCYDFAPDSVTVWKELGRFVFAVTQGSALIYAQKLPYDEFSQEAALEIKLAVTQLNFQGLSVTPKRLLLWDDASLMSTDQLSAVMGIPVEPSAKPSPRLPEKRSKLLPADVRAERLEQQMKQRLLIGGGVLGLLLIGFVGFAVFQWVNLTQEIEQKEAEYAQLRPIEMQVLAHQTEWMELEPLLDQERWPVELMYQVGLCMPRTGGLRLELCEFDESGLKVYGSSTDLKAANTFDLQLKRNAKLRDFEWNNRPAQQNSSGKWEFKFSAKIPNEEGDQ